MFGIVIRGRTLPRIHFITKTTRRPKPTTIGELDGGRSERIAAIASALEGAGFPASICANMDAWLKTHVAKMLPTAGALFYAGGHAEQLATNYEALRVMVRAIRGETMAIKVGHAEHAHRELQLLAQEFRALNAATRLPTPAMDRLFEHLESTVAHDLAS